MSVVTPTMSSTIQRQSWGAQTVVFGTMAFDNSGYDAAGGGDVITPSKFGLLSIDHMVLESTAGYMLNYIESSGRVKVYLSAGGSGTTGATSGGTPAGTIAVTGVNASAGTPAGTNAASVVAGQLDLTTPAFSGTGYATAGQDVTTTDNQTMALNECAGMWFIADGLPASPAVLILSNTAVAGAPAVLTCNGVPPVTDVGTYKIVKVVGTAAAQTFTGAAMGNHLHADTAAFTGAALATHTHTTAGGTAGEVGNGVDISALTTVTFIAIGR